MGRLFKRVAAVGRLFKSMAAIGRLFKSVASIGRLLKSVAAICRHCILFGIKLSRYSIRQTKRLLHRKMLMTLDDDLREELRSIREAGNGPDFQEAIRKFAEKFGKNKKKNKSDHFLKSM